jgi:hypothetical protein
MKAKWVKIFESTNMHQVALFKALLDENKIPSEVLNKQDSVYLSLNSNTYVELLVPDNFALQAVQLIKNSEQL